MNRLSECAICRKLTEFCGTLSRYQFRKNYEITVGLYSDENNDTPEVSHCFRGNSQQNLLKMFGILGIIAISVALMRGLCRRLAK